MVSFASSSKTPVGHSCIEKHDSGGGSISRRHDRAANDPPCQRTERHDLGQRQRRSSCHGGYLHLTGQLRRHHKYSSEKAGILIVRGPRCGPIGYSSRCQHQARLGMSDSIDEPRHRPTQAHQRTSKSRQRPGPGPRDCPACIMDTPWTRQDIVAVDANRNNASLPCTRRGNSEE